MRRRCLEVLASRQCSRLTAFPHFVSPLQKNVNSSIHSWCKQLFDIFNLSVCHVKAARRTLNPSLAPNDLCSRVESMARWAVAIVQGTPHAMQRDVDVGIVSDAYLAERSERQRRIEAAAAEIAKTCAFWARGGATALCVDIITRHLDGKTT